MRLFKHVFVQPKTLKQGSALLLTLLVVSLLLVIVLAFVVTVRLEFRKIIEHQNLTLARANARLGANLALAELQRTMGPDQRVSARAEILSTDNPDGHRVGAQNEPPFNSAPSTRFWTGTWDSEAWNPGDPADRQGRFLRWLVSMPEIAAENIKTVSSLDVSDDEFFVTLATLLAEPASGGSPGDTPVRAALQPIQKLNPSTGTMEDKGKYAWWVSDEGVKANIAMADPYIGAADPADVEDGDFDAKIAQFLFPHRPNLSLTDWFGDLDFAKSYGAELNASLEKASGLPGSAWLALKAAEADITDNDVNIALSEDNIFADYSFFSHGVLSSTRRGGLRGDLSLAFWENAGLRFPIDKNRVDTNVPFEDDFRFRRIYSPTDYDDMTQGGGSSVGSLNPFGPRWEVLRDFHNSFQKITTDSDGYQVVRAAKSDVDTDPALSYHEHPRRQNDQKGPGGEKNDDIIQQLGGLARAADTSTDGRGDLGNRENIKSPVYPVLTRVIMEFQGTLVENPDQDPTVNPKTYRPEIRVGLYATLWNPYNVPISLTNPTAGRGGGRSGIQPRMSVTFGPDQFNIFEIEIDGETWDLGGGSNNEVTGEYDSIFAKSYYGRGGKGGNPNNPVNSSAWTVAYRLEDVRLFWGSNALGGDPMVNSDLEAGEVRLYAVNGVKTDSLTAAHYNGEPGNPLSSMTSYFTSIDNSGYLAFRKNFKKKLGFWDDPNDSSDDANANSGYSSGESVSFQLKVKSGIEPNPEFDFNFKGYGSKPAEQMPLHDYKTTIDLTVEPQKQAIKAGDVVSLGYIEFILKSGNETDPRNYSDLLDMPVPRFTHFNPRAWVANDANAPYGAGQNPNYWFGIVSEGDRANYTDTVRDSGPRSSVQYHRAYWGADHLPGDGRNFLAFFDVPRRPVESMGQYQHAYLSWLANQPAYAFGNSLADIHVPANGVIARYDDGSDNVTVSYMDLSWFLNDALWDDYFLSTINPYVDLSDPAVRLRPQRSRFVELDRTVVYNRGDSSSPDDATSYKTSAGNMLLRGAFNVNSTSVEAWKAVLAPLGNDGILYLDPTRITADETTGVLEFPFYRLSLPLGAEDEAWTGGPRNLSDAQMTALAESIVEQVKQRGPFLSVSDFVNRRMGSDTDSRAQMGAIQRALEEQNTSIQDLVESTGEVSFSAGQGPRYWENLPDSVRQKPLAFAPGDLTQADVLTAIGPLLSARSDTFVIRSFGSTRNNSSGDTQSRAWCEMVVQRVPGALEADPADPYATGPFGRSFQIVSFRYLEPNDL